jgi:hypothetical protein
MAIVETNAKETKKEKVKIQYILKNAEQRTLHS